MKKSLVISTIVLFVFGSFASLASRALADVPGNIIANPTFALGGGVNNGPLNWNSAAWGDAGSAVFNYPVAGEDDNFAAQLTINSYGTATGGGAAEWYFDPVAVTGDGFYYFSDWYNSNVNSYLIAQFNLSDSPNPVYSQLATLAPTGGQWANTTQDISVPVDAVSMTILHLLQSQGTLTVDNYSLSPASPPAINGFDHGMVSLSFDDGYADHYNTVLPILNAAGQHGTFYIITNPILAADSVKNLLVSSGISTSTVTTNSQASWGNIINGQGAAIYIDPTFQDYTFSESYTATAATNVNVNYCSIATNADCPATDTVTTLLGSLPAVATPTAASFDFILPTLAGATVHPISITQTLATPGTLTASSPSVIPSQTYMTQTQLLALQAAGNEVSSHTEDHCDLVQLSLDPNSAETSVGCPDYTLPGPSTAQEQIAGSKTALINLGLSPVDTLAYPFGNYTSEIEQETQAAGYTAARSVDVGYNTKTSDPFDLKVQNVDASTTVAQIENWINTAVVNKVWLILVFHQVDPQSVINENDEVYGVTPDTLQQVSDYLKNNSVDVETVADGADIMEASPVEPVISPSSLPAANVLENFNQTISATDGDPADSFHFVLNGSLPAGLNLNGSTGVISGTSTIVGTVSFSVTAISNSNAGETATQNYSLQTVDTIPPVIGFSPNISAEATGPLGAVVNYPLPLVTDNYDATVTPSCAPASGSMFALGTTTVTCIASDSSGNAATATVFQVKVVDTTPPVISLNGDATTTVTFGNGFVDPGASAVDLVDGDLSANVVATGSVITRATPPGTYTIFYNVTDSAGNQAATVSRTVIVVAPPNAVTNSSTNSSGGTSFGTMEVSPQPQVPQVLGASTVAGAHVDGTLILEGQTVYLIQDGQLFGFRNPQEFESYGYKFSQVVPANQADLALTFNQTDILKAMEGTLALDAADHKTVYMIGSNYTKRGFVSAAVFNQLGYVDDNLPVINLADYPTGAPITSASATHPEGSLVLDGNTIWWVGSGVRQGFVSAQVFNSYGFPFSRVILANAADEQLPQISAVKFRDGTLVTDGLTDYIISDGQAVSFASQDSLVNYGYSTDNLVAASVEGYPKSSLILQ